MSKAPALLAWLYKHDKTWLKQHAPQPIRARNLSHIDWEKRDAELVFLARETVPKVLATKPPVRWWAAPNMVNVAEYFGSTVESVSAYQIRRLIWARACLPMGSKMKIQEFLAFAAVTRFAHGHPMYFVALEILNGEQAQPALLGLSTASLRVATFERHNMGQEK